MQWYPGHMKKAKQEIRNNLKLVDKVVYLIDARIPISSRNLQLEKIFSNKEVILVLNKRDLASQHITKKWIKKLREKHTVIAINSLTSSGRQKLLKIIKTEDKVEHKKPGSRDKTRLMIVGMPNVGKSQLINSLLKRNSARTGNAPGVTRGKQWIRVDNKLELLDTPGVLVPNIDDKERGSKLAACGIIKDSIFDSETVAYYLLDAIKDKVAKRLKERFKLNNLNYQTYDLIAEMARNRGCLQSGGRVDRERISNIIITEFKKGEFGAVTLEEPELEENNNEIK